MTKILLYHIYPINQWRDITEILFKELPFDKVVVHVSLPNDGSISKQELESYFQKYGVHDFLYTANRGIGEVDAMINFVRSVEMKGFDILTYMHCKGVTKPDNKHILSWTKLMRYFIIEKMDICKKAFKKGYVTCGINKSVPNQKDEGFHGCSFFYEGNFVSLNLKKVDLKKAVEEHLEHTYYGLEGFWGKLCDYELGFTMFNSGINHYVMTVEENDYTTTLARMKYNMIRNFYSVRSRFKQANKD